MQPVLVVQLYIPSVFMSIHCLCIVAVQHVLYKASLSIEHINLSYKQTEIRAYVRNTIKQLLISYEIRNIVLLHLIIKAISMVKISSITLLNIPP